MKPTVRTLLFGDPQECSAVGEALSDLDVITEHDHVYCSVNDLEEFEEAMVQWEPSLMIVLADGAVGMESVYRSRQRRPNVPVFWFSDDREFGMQSYRMECAYFSTKPVTPEKISNAIHRCHHVGISYAAV